MMNGEQSHRPVDTTAHDHRNAAVVSVAVDGGVITILLANNRKIAMPSCADAEIPFGTWTDRAQTRDMIEDGADTHW